MASPGRAQKSLAQRDGRYLPRPRPCVASRQVGSSELRPDQGDDRNRGLPHGGPRRPCRAGWKRARPSCCPYFHVVFTLPPRIGAIAHQNKAVIYDLLFKASAETLLTIASDPKRLGVRIGFTSVLHTWGSAASVSSFAAPSVAGLLRIASPSA